MPEPSSNDHPVTAVGPGRRVLVLGLGRSGQAAALLAHDRGATVIGFDEQDTGGLREFRTRQASQFAIELGWHGDRLPDANLIIISPGLPPWSPLRRAAETGRVPVLGELAFGARFCPWPMLAVTGTNGKTTTTELIEHLLRRCAFRTLAAGNIGYPLSQVARENHDLDFIVAEVSSFQLEHAAGFVPHAAALLNITSDHMDRYPDFAAYAAVKLRLFAGLDDPRRCVIRHDLLPRWHNAFPDRPVPITFSVIEPTADWHCADNTLFHRDPDGVKAPFCRLEQLQLAGAHNIENLLAATAMVHAVTGLSPDRIAAAAAEFRTGRHRLEPVAEWRGIRFINDSKATNPDAVIRALAACGGERNVCLVAGGLDKDMDFRPVREAAGKIKCAFLTGMAKNRLATCWNDVIDCTCCDTFEEAVLGAMAVAVAGDVVLLSPGCASMDQFRDYQERGDCFINIIHRRIAQ